MSSLQGSSSSLKALFPKKRQRTTATVETVVASTGFPVSSRKRSRATTATTTTAATTTTTINSNKTEPTTQPSLSSLQSSSRQGEKGYNKRQNKLLDWHETAREIRTLGATAFDKQQQRSYQDEEYQRLTGGRQRKTHHVPRKIAQGIQRKAVQRQAAALEEARASGRVLPKQQQQQAKAGKKKGPGRNHKAGPAPSIGFVKKGVLQLKKKPV